MKSLVNETVSHNKFGTGTIIEENTLKIKVQFSGMEQSKIFAFPIAFEKFLVLKDSGLQEECHELAMQKREEMEREEAERIAEIKRIADEKRKERIEQAKLKRRAAAKKTTTAKKTTAKTAAKKTAAAKENE